ncbi:MAG: LytTR family DNA-binding domain-containing protein [Bacteroidetes bacterium]|jgi:two-component system LytT family response regulator|nr:LytTR family DNA-binding domain-containing protein [Bacteroidota bacterium]MDF1865627.1 LytTR family DNA-binding domain-containing protein [Saprospiraceae bacterium]
MSLTKIRSLIIDDDPFIKELLQDKLNQYFPEVEIVDTAGSGTEGLEKIASYQPELIFLDVEMADMTGFEMLSKIEDIFFQTIFITFYSHYAIKAIRFNALDYLVKPIDLGELRNAIKRYKFNSQQNKPIDKIQNALKNLKTEKAADQTLILQTQEGEMRMVLKNIIRIEGERNYSYIHLINNKKKLTTKTIGDMEELLSDKGFFRCHKSHIINFVHIQPDPKSFAVTLTDGIDIPIARRRKEAFKDWYDNARQ